MAVSTEQTHALTLLQNLGDKRDEMIGRVKFIGQNISELANANYKSATMVAYSGKFDGQIQPQFEKAFNRIESQIGNGGKYVKAQGETQDVGAKTIGNA